MQWRVCRQQALTEGSFPGGSSHRLVPFDPCNVFLEPNGSGIKPVTFSRRLLRQRDGRVDHRPVQDRAHRPTRSLAEPPQRGDGHAGVDRLVQQPPPVRGLGRYPTRRGRLDLLDHKHPVRKTSDGITHPPLNPGRFNSPKRASVSTHQVRVFGPHPGQVLASHDRRSDPALARVGQDAKDLPGQHVVPIRTRLGDL